MIGFQKITTEEFLDDVYRDPAPIEQPVLSLPNYSKEIEVIAIERVEQSPLTKILNSYLTNSLTK